MKIIAIPIAVVLYLLTIPVGASALTVYDGDSTFRASVYDVSADNISDNLFQMIASSIAKPDGVDDINAVSVLDSFDNRVRYSSAADDDFGGSDRVFVDEPVRTTDAAVPAPEPATATLMWVGLVSLAITVRRQLSKGRRTRSTW